jgi:hypothetical protein
MMASAYTYLLSALAVDEAHLQHPRINALILG